MKGSKYSSPAKKFPGNLNELSLNSLTKSPSKSHSTEKQHKQHSHSHQNSPSPSSQHRHSKSKHQEIDTDYGINYKNSTSPHSKHKSMQSNESIEIEQSRKSTSGNMKKSKSSSISLFILESYKTYNFFFQITKGHPKENDTSDFYQASLESKIRHAKKRSSKERIFIALFNYDPYTMSPNVETCNEELPFVEGQFIKVYGEQDSDGFYFGESQGKCGYVPYNMVSEVQVEDSYILDQLMTDINRPNQEKAMQAYNKQQQNDKRRKNKNIYQMIALYDYDPQALSPNSDMDVKIILIIF